MDVLLRKNIYKGSWDYRYTDHFTMVMQTAVSVHPPSCFLPNQDFCSHLQVQWQFLSRAPFDTYDTFWNLLSFFIWYFSVTEYIRPLPLLLSSVICLLDIGKDLLTLRSPWVPRCRGPVLALFFHTHFILSIFPPNTVALQSSPRSQGQILQIHSFTRDPLCSLEAIGQASLLPIFAIFCLLLLSGGGFFWFVCVLFFFSPNTFPDNSCCSQDILENIHCVQIPNCKWILPECCIMVHGWLPNHWLAVMLEAPWHIFMAKVNYC